jgi:hypothetical protein
VTFSLQYKGFDYVAFFNGAYEDSDSLPSLAQTGANSIEATLDYGIDVTTSQVVTDANYTDSLAALGSTIAQAESLGLSVMIRPLIDFLNPAVIGTYSVGEWRQDYQPTNVAAFFASYQQMIVTEAKVAQLNGAQMLSIGAELDQLAGAQYLPYWTDIISAVREVYNGKLTYSASWNTASNVSFWNQLDYEGVDCYVPLSNAQNPALKDLINGWLDPATQSTNPGAYAVIGNQSPIQYFENLAAQSGKPLLFTELGYSNDSGSAADPSASGNSTDPTLQAELYQAFFQAWAESGSPSLVGSYFWEWDPNGSTSNAGPAIDSFSPQNNPAQNQAAAGFGATGNTSPPTWNQIDNGTPVAMTGGDFEDTGSAQIASSYGGYGTYLWANGVGFAKIDNGVPNLLTSGDFAGLGHSQLAGVFAGYGIYTYSIGVGWTHIDNGTPGLLISGDFDGTSNGNNNNADLAGFFPGYGSYIWTLSTGWNKIDPGTPTAYAAGNFLGTSNGNNNQTDLAAYFAGSGTFIWSANGGWTKIDLRAASGLAAVDLNGNGQNELLAYFPGSGMYEYQNGTGWTKYDSTSALPTNAQQALFATGNFQGGTVVDAAVAFNGAAGMWLDPPAGATSSGSSAQGDASSAIGTAQVTSQLNPAAFATSIAGPSETPQPNLSAAFATPSAGPSETLQNGQSPAFAGTIGGLAGQDQPTLGYAANSGNSGAAPNEANIALLGSYMASSFVTSADGNGGTLISETAQATNEIASLAQPHAAGH